MYVNKLNTLPNINYRLMLLFFFLYINKTMYVNKLNALPKIYYRLMLLFFFFFFFFWKCALAYIAKQSMKECISPEFTD